MSSSIANSKSDLRQKIREALGKISLAVRTAFPHLPRAATSFSFPASFMTIELPNVKVGSQPLTDELARLDFAIGLYTGRHASLGYAAKVSGLSKVLFMQELGRREIVRHYRDEDVAHDFQMASELAGKSAAA